MKKSFSLFIVFCAIFIIPVLCQAAGCPDCSTDDVTIQDYIYSSDSDCNCEAPTVTFGPNVTVRSGAKVTLRALKIDFKAKVAIENGADFKTDLYSCGAYIAFGIWKEFDCYNLAAIGKTTSDNPFTPTWRLIGGYWQWGRKGPDASQWYTTNTVNFAHGPTGPGPVDDNAFVSGWFLYSAPNGSWSDTQKTTNDPCPPGFRVPTKSQWDGVRANNIQSTTGSWSDSSTNYSSAWFFGNKLMLSAAGYRNDSNGSLSGRGNCGVYWSSAMNTVLYAWTMNVYSSFANTGYSDRRFAFSVRCIAE